MIIDPRPSRADPRPAKNKTRSRVHSKECRWEIHRKRFGQVVKPTHTYATHNGLTHKRQKRVWEVWNPPVSSFKREMSILGPSRGCLRGFTVKDGSRGVFTPHALDRPQPKRRTGSRTSQTGRKTWERSGKDRHWENGISWDMQRVEIWR